jgi:hypothetical protein
MGWRQQGIGAMCARVLLVAALAVWSLAATARVRAVADASTPDDPPANPIVIENQLPGTDAWRIGLPGSGSLVADDAAGQIKGYASATSVDRGDQISFFVSVNPAQSYTVEVYRLGWYGGAGGRLVVSFPARYGSPQPACPLEPTTGLIECAWAPAMTFTVPSTWTTGAYVAILTNAAGYHNYLQFVVRDDARVAPFVYQLPFLTYQAYNLYPNDRLTGKSLYASVSAGAPTVGGSRAAVKVSFDRPFWGHGLAADFVRFDVPTIAWLEEMGYDVTYASSLDLHGALTRLTQHQAFISGGHDEYWTRPMYDHAVALRDRGVHLAFFGSNAVYWQVRLEPSTAGVPDRVVVCYRDAAIDPIEDESLQTVRWRDAPLLRPEQQLVGIQFASIIRETTAYVVQAERHWIYDGTAVANGDRIAGLVAGEGDRFFADVTPPPAVEHVLLGASPFMNTYGGPDQANASLYRTAGGAMVFAAGTLNWGPALGSPTMADARVQRMTQNLLNQFLLETAAPRPCERSARLPRCVDAR